MPTVQIKTPIRDDGQRFPNLLYLYNHYEVAGLDQIHSDLFASSFNRLQNSTLESQLARRADPKIKLDVYTVMFKRQLLEDLTNNGITFDEYRRSKSLPMVDELKQRYQVPRHKQIYIHETDFVDYQLETLACLESLVDDDYPLLYQVYSPKLYVASFERYMDQFHVQLDRAMVLGHDIDTRITSADIRNL